MFDIVLTMDGLNEFDEELAHTLEISIGRAR